MSVDYRLQDRLREAQRENARIVEQEPPLEPGGGGGDSGGMDGLAERVMRVEGRLDVVEHRMGALESRMDRLEVRMDGLDTRLRGVEQKLEAVAAQLNLLTTQIVAKLPSWWQMPAVIGSTVAVLAALWAAGRWMAKLGYL